MFFCPRFPDIFRCPKDDPAPQYSHLAYPANCSLQQHGRSNHRNDDYNGSDNQPVSPPRPCLRRPIVLLLRLACRSLGGPSGLFFLLGFLKFSHGLPCALGLWSWWLLPGFDHRIGHFRPLRIIGTTPNSSALNGLGASTWDRSRWGGRRHDQGRSCRLRPA